MSRETSSWLVWGAWLALFCVLEGLAVFWPRCPWTTFSRMTWGLQQRWEWLTVPVVAILAILASHLIRLTGVQEGDPPAIVDEVDTRKRKKAIKVLNAPRPK